MSLKLSVSKGRCTLSYPTERLRQYYINRGEAYPEQALNEVLFRNTTRSSASHKLKQYGHRRPLLAVYSSVEELVIEAKTSSDMDACISLMRDLFKALPTFATAPSHPQWRVDMVRDEYLVRYFKLNITACEEIGIQAYQRLMEIIEEPGELDFSVKTTLRIPGCPTGKIPKKRVAIGYAVHTLIVENLGPSFKFDTWFTLSSITGVESLIISYEKKTYVKIEKILIPFFTRLETFDDIQSLSLSNVCLKVQTTDGLDKAGWRLPNLKSLQFNNLSVVDRRPEERGIPGLIYPSEVAVDFVGTTGGEFFSFSATAQ